MTTANRILLMIVASWILTIAGLTCNVPSQIPNTITYLPNHATIKRPNGPAVYSRGSHLSSICL